MRRFTAFAATLITFAAAPSAHAATRGNWNLPQQEAVADAGVLPRLSDRRFHGERALTGAQLADALTVITGDPAAASSAAKLSVTAFDARLVHALDLDDVAAHVQRTAREAGLKPPRFFGTEVVARFLGGRTAAQMAGEIRDPAPPPGRDPARRPGLLRPRELQRQGDRSGRRSRRDRALRALDDPRLGTGRVRVLARRRLAA